MAMQGHTVIDVDAHYIDHFDDIYTYLNEDDPWRYRFKNAFGQDGGGLASLFPVVTENRYNQGIHRPEFDSKEDILSAMDNLDIDKILLIGNQMLQFGAMKADDERPIKYTRAYMDHLLNGIADADENIYVTVPVIHADPDAAVEEIERVADKEAVAGVVMVAHSSGGGPPFGNHRYDPIYEICEERDLPVIVHAAGTGLDDSYLQGYGTALETQALGFPLTNITELTSMIIQGVPVKFPDLDVVFIEAGLFWVPLMMARLDEEYIRMPDEAPLLEKLPSEYMKEFYYGTQPLEGTTETKHLEHVFDMVGPENVVYSSDWPHRDYDEPSAVTDLPFLSSEEKRAVLGGNAEEVFGI